MVEEMNGHVTARRTSLTVEQLNYCLSGLRNGQWGIGPRNNVWFLGPTIEEDYSRLDPKEIAARKNARHEMSSDRWLDVDLNTGSVEIAGERKPIPPCVVEFLKVISNWEPSETSI